MNEMPVAASGVLDTVAVISPKPTELSGNIAVTDNAKNARARFFLSVS